ncbi:unnamed protein product [Jaminaea pallidilutea]
MKLTQRALPSAGRGLAKSRIYAVLLLIPTARALLTISRRVHLTFGPMAFWLLSVTAEGSGSVETSQREDSKGRQT